MSIKIRSAAAAAAFVLAYLLAPGASASPQGFEPTFVKDTSIADFHTSPPTDAAPHYFDKPLSCVDDVTGALLNCYFEYKLLGLDTQCANQVLCTGGHFHNSAGNASAHPVTFTPGELLKVTNGINVVATATDVSGNTNFATIEVSQELSSFAGVFDLELVVIFDALHTCAGPYCEPVSIDPDHKVADWGDNVAVGLMGGQFQFNYLQPLLTPLPSPSTYYFIRDPNPDHTDGSSSSPCTDALGSVPPTATCYTYGTWAWPDTVDKMQTIGLMYQLKTDNNLSINDMSLPFGGSFDYLGNWGQPHMGHDDGFEADINLADSGGVQVSCGNDFDLKRAVKAVLGKISYLHCELFNGDPQGKKHIQFNNLY